MNTSDDSFINAFENGTLPIEEWKHEAHVRVSWIYLSRHPYQAASERIKTGIKNFIRMKGLNAGGYSETLTQVYIHLIEFLRRNKAETAQTWNDFRSSSPEILDRVDPLPLRHYRKETILSEAGKSRFIEPDLKPLPPL